MLSATASDRLACASAGGTTFARLDEALGGRAGGEMLEENRRRRRSRRAPQQGRRRRAFSE